MNTDVLAPTATAIKSAENTSQNIDLVNGHFTTTEAREVILSLLDQKLNFHKTKRFQLWTQDRFANFDTLDNRIAELEKEKERALKFLEAHQDSASKLKLNASLNLEIVE